MRMLELTCPCERTHLNSELFELDIISKLNKRPLIIQFKDLLCTYEILDSGNTDMDNT